MAFKLRLKNFNKCIIQDLVLAENNFERLCSFGPFYQKQNWDEKKYKMYLQTEIAMTNVSVHFNALRANDRNLYYAVHNCIFTIAEEKARKRTKSQMGYRENRKKRLSSNGICTKNVNTQ